MFSNGTKAVMALVLLFQITVVSGFVYLGWLVVKALLKYIGA